jgi:hypothetical protein
MTAPASASTAGSPLLSVVVTIVDGGDVLRRCLNALGRQQDPPALEILVPYDASIAETAKLQSEYPHVTFVDMGVIRPRRPLHTAAGQHDLYDRRRAAGLAAARGDIVAIVEDRGAPRPQWARAVVRAHDQPRGAVGGAVQPVPDAGTLNWAFYVCDFGRYGLPFESGPVSWVTDINVSYRRAIVDATRELWKDGFREPIVHWAILERGESLYLSSDIVVEHGRPPIALGPLLRERFGWGRLFGEIRAEHVSPGKRAMYALVGPLLPFLLLVRHGRTQHRQGNLGRYVRTMPATALLLAAWVAGETWGVITKRA